MLPDYTSTTSVRCPSLHERMHATATSTAGGKKKKKGGRGGGGGGGGRRKTRGVEGADRRGDDLQQGVAMPNFPTCGTLK